MDEILISLATRVEYVLMRMWCVVEYTNLVRNGEQVEAMMHVNANVHANNNHDHDHDYSLHNLEKELGDFVKTAYGKFVREKVQFCYSMAREDILALFRFVSWDLAFGDTKMNVNAKAVDIVSDDELDLDEDTNVVGGRPTSTTGTGTVTTTILDPRTDEILSSVIQAVQASTSSPSSSSSTSDKSATGQELGQTCAAINVLVQHVTNRWRGDVSQIVMTKFNAYCMLPLHEEFLGYLRREMNGYIADKFV